MLYPPENPCSPFSRSKMRLAVWRCLTGRVLSSFRTLGDNQKNIENRPFRPSSKLDCNHRERLPRFCPLPSNYEATTGLKLGTQRTQHGVYRAAYTVNAHALLIWYAGGLPVRSASSSQRHLPEQVG